MSKIVPKEELSAYQRWELGGLGERIELPPATPPAGLPDAAKTPSTAEPAFVMPTAADLEALEEQARAEGYAAGYAEGRAQADAEAARLRGLADDLAGTAKRAEEELAEAVMKLALGVARQVIRERLRAKPELLLGVVREALQSLPMVNEHPRLVAHPADAALLRAYLDEDSALHGWRLHEDETVTPGGCRLETAYSEIDAGLEARWQRALAAIGREGAWED